VKANILCRLYSRIRRAYYNAILEVGWRSYARFDGGDLNWADPGESDWHLPFVADPFLFVRHDGLWLFYETLNRDHKGVLGCFKYADGQWVQQGKVLEMPWHLSYPQVFETDGHVYMIPEQSNQGRGTVDLYEAQDFPYKWEKHSTLIDRPFADATLLHYDGYWYLACYRVPPIEGAELWCAPSLFGPWHRHPQFDKINQSKRLRRCGGAFINEGGRLYRVAQDCNGFYGIRLWQVPVTDISPTSYHEGEARVMIDKQDEPKGMKHTFNEVVYDGNRLEVIDLHWNALRPMKTIIHNLASLLLKRI